jgi:hypothetical protein
MKVISWQAKGTGSFLRRTVSHEARLFVSLFIFVGQTSHSCNSFQSCGWNREMSWSWWAHLASVAICKKDPPFVRVKNPPDLGIKEGWLLTSPFFCDVTQRRSCKSGGLIDTAAETWNHARLTSFYTTGVQLTAHGQIVCVCVYIYIYIHTHTLKISR